MTVYVLLMCFNVFTEADTECRVEGVFANRRDASNYVADTYDFETRREATVSIREYMVQ